MQGVGHRVRRGKAIAWRMMEDLVAELTDKDEESGTMNILVREILS